MSSGFAVADPDATAAFRGWIQEMQEAERGPFSRIRWFCNDGTVLPPGPSACRAHGGGHQHGEWSDRTRELRAQGYRIATVLAGLDPGQFLADPAVRENYAQLLVERYLVNADDGWIYRKARFYRSAIQEEDERAAARELLTAMASRPEWIGHRFTALRAGARMLPHGRDSASVLKVRQLAASLSDRDAGFRSLRAKIHGAPGAEDADQVRRYAAGLSDPAARKPYLELADEIDRIYRAAPLEKELEALAESYTAAPWLRELLSQAARDLRAGAAAADRFVVTASLLADLRRALPRIHAAGARLELLDLSLRVEGEHFRTATELRPRLPGATRHQYLAYLKAAGVAGYGTGLINARLLGELTGSIDSLGGETVSLDHYLDELRYLGRAPGWGTQSLRMHFIAAMEKLAEIEPLAKHFIEDQLRGSPLLFYVDLLDGLSRDANRLAQVRHRLFGESIGVGFTALNPGLASGILHAGPDLDDLEAFQTDGIYLLPETVPDLPPVAGILTEGEGNPLSHVQLLARNLGIPNVTVDSALQPVLAQHDGERVVLAVSPSGLVELATWEERWRDRLDGTDAGQRVRIEPDLDKLNLSMRQLISLDDLRATDSGRIVGPKAARLGELRRHSPGQVSRGVAIPFGIFVREVLEQPHPEGEGSVFEWIVRGYRRLEKLAADDPARAVQTEALRGELYELIVNTRPGQAFQGELRAALRATFGSDEPPGVFVRSDTNVEDLAGFTGAGLNLTLPNVVGFDNLLRSIAQVWASPFTARAFAWRQSHMTRPEHVYTSVLLLESVASDKSGVLVTQDIDSGDPDVLSVAVNEGVGGAVDGQAAESLRIALDGSGVRVLATATAPWRWVPDPAGGLRRLPASGSDTVLTPDEIAQLVDFARNLPRKFPPVTDDEGHPAPADVEFGFLDGRLRLFQLRPFLESRVARGIGYLQDMESHRKDADRVTVNMGEFVQ
ncbi:MAG: PEP/pyruvate-binding domain-containing protein [Halioglobus sp.]